MKKRLFVILISVCMVLNLCIGASANNTLIEHSHTTVIFDDNSRFTEEEKVIITNLLTEANTPTTVPYGLSCILFGHDYQLEYVTAIQHEVYAASPRCVRETYEVSVCTKCSDTQTKLILSERISCCP